MADLRASLLVWWRSAAGREVLLDGLRMKRRAFCLGFTSLLLGGCGSTSPDDSRRATSTAQRAEIMSTQVTATAFASQVRTGGIGQSTPPSPPTQVLPASSPTLSQASAISISSNGQPNVDFNGSTLPPGWKILYPDPTAWSLTGSVLHMVPRPRMGDLKFYNTFMHDLPTARGRLDITMKFRVELRRSSSHQFWLSLQVSEQRDHTNAATIGVIVDDGPTVYALQGDNSTNHIQTPLNQDTYLRYSRDDRGYTSFFSHDGQAWTFIDEWKGNVPAFDRVIFGGVGDSDPQYAVDVYWIHFDIPQS
jgi:hypothetical protein